MNAAIVRVHLAITICHAMPRYTLAEIALTSVLDTAIVFATGGATAQIQQWAIALMLSHRMYCRDTLPKIHRSQKVPNVPSNIDSLRHRIILARWLMVVGIAWNIFYWPVAHWLKMMEVFRPSNILSFGWNFISYCFIAGFGAACFSFGLFLIMRSIAASLPRQANRLVAQILAITVLLQVSVLASRPVAYIIGNYPAFRDVSEIPFVFVGLLKIALGALLLHLLNSVLPRILVADDHISKIRRLAARIIAAIICSLTIFTFINVVFLMYTMSGRTFSSVAARVFLAWETYITNILILVQFVTICFVAKICSSNFSSRRRLCRICNYEIGSLELCPECGHVPELLA